MIRTAADFRRMLSRISAGMEIYLDCEFQGERHYFPKLCLVQLLANGEAHALDPFELDLTPLGEVLADRSIVKVFHSAQNDIPLLVRATGKPVRNVFDTQVAGAFAGFGTQPSYGSLVDGLCGISVSKGQRYTNWLARPLQAEQVAYALEDVRHLPGVATALRKRLAELERTGWAEKAMEEMVTKASATRREPSEAYLKLGSRGAMSARELAVLRAVAAWREELAAEKDVNLRRLANDEALRQLALDPPRNRQAVRTRRGLQINSSEVDSLLEAVRRSLNLPEAELPLPPTSRALDRRVEPVSLLLSAALSAPARSTGLTSSVIATRKELKALAAWHFEGRPGDPPELVDPSRWKYEVVGPLLLSVLDGEQCLFVGTGPSGVECSTTFP
jgi:ribonuclease D